MDDEGAFTLVVCVLAIIFGCFIGYGCGRERLAKSIANGTHVVEIQKFSDGTQEVRIVEVTNAPAN